MRNRGAESCGKASTTCCAVQAAVGESVTREPHPEDAVEETDPRSLGAAAEQGELLSQRQVLKNEVGRTFSAARRVPSRASRRDIATQARLTGDQRPAWRPVFWPTTGSRRTDIRPSEAGPCAHGNAVH